MISNSRKIQKSALAVEIALNDGSIIFGKVFVSMQGRLVDALNDERDFLPIEASDGSFMALSKSAIKQVTLPADEAAAYKGTDPYLILGVEQNVTQEDLKKAYHQLVRTNHPDRLKGFGLSQEYLELATQNMARINSAYAHLTKTLSS
jgi:DnaJ-domain-containing protein 1